MAPPRGTSAAQRARLRLARTIAGFSFDRLIAAEVLVLTCAAGFLAKVQSDTWWHLRAGLEMVGSGHLMMADSFSHTAYGAYWPNYEWLSQLLFFGLYRLGGVGALAVFCGALTAAACVMSFGLMRGRAEGRALLFLVAALGVARGWAVRPQVISLTLVMATAWLLVAERRRWLPLLFLLWANLHGAVAWGVVLLAADVISNAFGRDKARVRGSLGWAALALLATQGTPLGFSYWPDIIWSIRRSELVSEWQPPGLSGDFIPFWALLAALGAAAIRWLGRVPDRRGKFIVVAAILMGVSAARVQRNISAFSLVAAPALSHLLWRPRAEAPDLAAEVTPVRGWVHAVLVTVTAGFAVTGVLWVWRERPEMVGSRPMSSAAATAIGNCPPPLYNHFNDGGFVIWFAPTQRVFLDSRLNPYPPELVRAQVDAERTGNYDPLLTQYGTNCAVAAPGSQTVTVLASKGWRQTFRDRQWVVLVRPGEGQ